MFYVKQIAWNAILLGEKRTSKRGHREIKIIEFITCMISPRVSPLVFIVKRAVNPKQFFLTVIYTLERRLYMSINQIFHPNERISKFAFI